MSFEPKIRWISASMDSRTLNELKCRFKSDINSKRKYSQVNTFFDLVGILLARGIVSYEDITILNNICQEYFRINFNEIPDSLGSARSPTVQRNLQLPFSTRGLVAGPSGLTNGYRTSGGNSGMDSKVIPPEIVDIIVAGNITEKKWRPFARALQVDTESIAHEADKVRKALSTFLQKTDPHHQWSRLEVALETIHRIDLREQCRSFIPPQH